MTPPLRTRAVTALVWAVLLSGPVLGALALLSGGGGATASAATTPVPVVGGEAFAELVVIQHLTAGLDDVDPRVAPVHQSLRMPADGSAAVARPPLAVAAIGTEPAGPGRVGVHVLVLDHAGTTRTWQVTVAATAEGPVLEGRPALLPTTTPAPPQRVATSPLQPPTEGDPLAAAAEGFLGALLAGDGDLQRYAAPSSGLVAADPPLLASLDVTAIGTHVLGPGSAAVVVEVTATGPGLDDSRLQYPLLLAQRDGRWEVSRVLPALPLAPTSQ